MAENKAMTHQVHPDLGEADKQGDNTSGRCVKLAISPQENGAKVGPNAAATSAPSPSGEVKVAQAGVYASTGEKRIRVQLTWENIVVKPRERKSEKEKLILDHVCGTVRPEQFLAIIGASGTPPPVYLL